MSNQRPIAIDLFAGAGGLSLGLEQAGFDVVAAVEIDPVHCCVHKYNFPQWSVLPQSVTNISGKAIRRDTGLADSQPIHLVAGGAPCQGFSLIGQRALDDPRNHLVRDYIRIIKELQPAYFLFENVKGLTIGKHRKFLEEIIEELSRLNYEIVTPWRVLNAKDYGVPQSRERLFLIGAKKGNPLPSYPLPGQVKAVTCKDALEDLPNAEDFEGLRHRDEVPFQSQDQHLSEYAAEMRCTHESAWKLGYRRQWNPALLTSSLRTNHTEKSRQRFAATAPGTVDRVSRFLKLAEDGVANTLRAGTDSARGAFTSPRPIHYKYPRCVTVREMGRLHGFPDWFRFHGTKWHGARQIGNSVPPPLAYAIAKEIIQCLDLDLKPPRKNLSLGDRKLLTYDPTAAAKYWCIKNPIAKRNRSLTVLNH